MNLPAFVGYHLLPEVRVYSNPRWLHAAPHTFSLSPGVACSHPPMIGSWACTRQFTAWRWISSDFHFRCGPQALWYNFEASQFRYPGSFGQLVHVVVPQQRLRCIDRAPPIDSFVGVLHQAPLWSVPAGLRDFEHSWSTVRPDVYTNGWVCKAPQAAAWVGCFHWESSHLHCSIGCFDLRRNSSKYCFEGSQQSDSGTVGLSQNSVFHRYYGSSPSVNHSCTLSSVGAEVYQFMIWANHNSSQGYDTYQPIL